MIILIGMEMDSVMMKITMKHAYLMVETVVDQILILITVQYVNASVMEDQVVEMGALQLQLLLLLSQQTVEDVILVK